MNPTDNLNPDDLTYIFDFGEKIPTLAANAIFYISDDFSIGVWAEAACFIPEEMQTITTLQMPALQGLQIVLWTKNRILNTLLDLIIHLKQVYI